MSRKFEFVKRISGEDCENIDLPENFDLPKRSTKFSAGYDFINPEKIELEPHKIYYVKTGIKADMEENEFLMLCNRSSNPKKKNLVLINGVGIIDKDYYNNSDNEGEIAFAFMNISNETIIIEAGEKLGQGIFMKYEIKDNDNAKGDRNGGFGSTDKQKENQAFAQGLANQLAEAISNSMNTQLNNSIMGGSING